MDKSEKIKITALTALLIAVLILLYILRLQTSQNSVPNNTVREPAYVKELFSHSKIINIKIDINDNDWSQLLQTAPSKTVYSCTVTVNNQILKAVGLSAKGNTSLSEIFSNGGKRFGFKLNFGSILNSQTCFGLDELILNSGFADATEMKEAIAYDMFNYLGACAPLYNYARLSINGEYFGVYLALEPVKHSFISRNYISNKYCLYKPDSKDFNRVGDISGGAFDKAKPFVKNGSANNTSTKSLGADLNYIDEKEESYRNIWENEVFKTNSSDHERVISALKDISDRKNISKRMNVDNILKVMAVHTFMVNLDSLSGASPHNYYLYEENGLLDIIPWDYNLSFGGFSNENAAEMINFPIDTPFTRDISKKDRDFFYALLEDKEYLLQYHKYLDKLCEEYVNKGHFRKTYARIRKLINPLVQDDPTSFYTYKEFDTAADMLYDTIYKRSESIEGQLNGTIGATYQARSKNSRLSSAAGIETKKMGGIFKDSVKMKYR